MELSLQRGAIPVTLDRDRILFFEFKASWLLDQKYGAAHLLKLYRMRGDKEIEIVDPEALTYFLWAGLQADAKNRGEEYTLEQAELAINPLNYSEVVRRVVYAVVRSEIAPDKLGKMTATGPAAKPAASEKATPINPGPTAISTSMKRSGSRSTTSAGRPSASGRGRSVSSTSRGKATSRKKK